MKTKTKMIALVEIAIVLCSLFLVALPGIAAQEQNQELQKVSVSDVTTASEDDYVLGVYGNANEDDTIDMGDVVYTKLAIFGKKPKTELCDAKYDGRINVLDVIQTKLIILGKEREITIEIPACFIPAQIVTVHKPVKRIVVLWPAVTEVLRSINAADKIVGVCTRVRDGEVFFQDLSKLPCIGRVGSGLDYEAILNLNPDLFMPHIRRPGDEEKLPGVTVIDLDLDYPEDFTERVRLLGYILDKEEEAEEYINWYDGWIDKINSRIEGLSEDEKLQVFHWSFFRPGAGYKTVGNGPFRINEMSNMAGGINIAQDLSANWPTVDPEWVIERNPDIIVAQTFISQCGYGVDDPSEIASARENILNRPELAKVTAVKTGKVYMISFLDLATGGSCCLIGIAYMAKWFHPELFEDLDPKAIHQEYLIEFQHLDYDLDKHGIFVYHPEEHPDGH